MRGVPRACHPSQSHACLAIWASTPRGGAGMGAYTLPALGSVAGTVWVWSRARFTHGQIRGLHAGQRGDPEKSWVGNAGLGTREQQAGGKKRTDSGKRSTRLLVS